MQAAGGCEKIYDIILLSNENSKDKPQFVLGGLYIKHKKGMDEGDIYVSESNIG